MHLRKITSAILVVLVLVLSIKPGDVLADYANYRTCSDAETCVIGEFLYDDDYVPITTATCTLSTKNPDGSTYLNAVNMPGQSDGWYAYTPATSSKPTGLYRSQMCCTVNSELMCLDKSFIIADQPTNLTEAEVSSAVWDANLADHNTVGTFGKNLQNSSSLSADDIWSYPTRSLTNFGSLISDIWSYSTRTMSSLGTLVADIWNHSTRKITHVELASGSLATTADVTTTTTNVSNVSNLITNEVTNISNQVTELQETATANNQLLEEMAHEPIIKTFLEDDQISSEEPVTLQSKINKSKQIARQLSTETKNLKQELIALRTGWSQDSETQSLAAVSGVSRVLGVTTDQPETPSIVSQVEWLRKAWDSTVVAQIKNHIDSSLMTSNSTVRELKFYGKTATSLQYLNLADAEVSRLEKVIGSEKTTLDKNTLFGYLEQVEKYAQVFENYHDQIETVLAKFGTGRESELRQQITHLENQIAIDNQLPSLAPLLVNKPTTSTRPLASEENALLHLKTIVEANLLLLSQAAEQPIKNVWIENGSITFKFSMTNPSKVISQTMPIKYFLPKELNQEDILELDENLTVSYDTQEGALFLAGEVVLGPQQTKTYQVKTADVWQTSEEEIETLRKQAEILFSPLKNTAYFAQGATLKADIDVSLDKIELLLQGNHTPEARIRAYRQAKIEMVAAQGKIDNLKTLVSSAGSVGTIFGFVGGVQTIAVWGLIIILIAGFVFLALYIRTISKPKIVQPKIVQPKMAKPPCAPTLVEKIASKSDLSVELAEAKLYSRLAFSNKALLIFVVILSLAVLSLILFILTTPNRALSSVAVNAEQIIPEETPVTSTPTVLGVTTQAGEPILISIPSYAKIVRVRAEPNLDADTTYIIWTNKKAYKIGEVEDWVQVELVNPENLAAPIRGWVFHEFVTEKKL